MWTKILCIEYILWGIPTIESTFDVANMVTTATVKDVPIKKLCASKHTGLLNSCLGKLCLHPYLVVPLISARVTLISTRVSAHCQAILFQINKVSKSSSWHCRLISPSISWSAELLFGNHMSEYRFFVIFFKTIFTVTQTLFYMYHWHSNIFIWKYIWNIRSAKCQPFCLNVLNLIYWSHMLVRYRKSSESIMLFRMDIQTDTWNDTNTHQHHWHLRKITACSLQWQ